jgi:hypothetical protein
MKILCMGYISDGRHVKCGALLGECPDPIGWDRATLDEPISHGLCPVCAKIEMARIEKEAAEIEAEDEGPITSW